MVAAISRFVPTKPVIHLARHLRLSEAYCDPVADHLSPRERSDLMSRVGTRDTSPELALRKALWAAGVRGWRCHPRKLPGKPDLAFGRPRVAVFVDGAFWHGHPEYYWGQSGPFWDRKIEGNRARDQRVNAELAAADWTVVRLWDFEVDRNLAESVERVQTALRRTRSDRLVTPS